MADAQWHAVRCVVRGWPPGVRVDGDPENLYEERVTLWRAESFEEAIRLAEEEVRSYCADTDSEYIGLAQAFAMFDEPRHGVEVFSLMRASDLDDAEYIKRHFETGSERQSDSGA